MTRAKVLWFRMRDLRHAGEVWREHRNRAECPTTEQLRRDGAIDANRSFVDSWGAPLRIVCEDRETFVISPGRDGELGTADDVRFPDATQ
jgi:hypothetical protein